MARYVPTCNIEKAKALVSFEVANISKSGSVKGMQKLYGWPRKGQVRMGHWVYNIGPENVEKLYRANLLRDS